MKANYWLIHSALGSLEIQEAMHGEIECDPDDEHSMMRVFRNIVKPAVDQWDIASHEKLKVALAYYMDKPDVLEQIRGSVQDLSISDPNDFTVFFQWFWRALFPLERWQDISIDRVIENNDPMEINAIGRR